MLLTAKEARDIRNTTLEEYGRIADEKILEMLPQIKNEIIEACKKTATSATINLIYPKDYDPILRREIRVKLINLLHEFGYDATWEDTVTEKSSSSWWRKKTETIIDKISVEWRHNYERHRS